MNPIRETGETTTGDMDLLDSVQLKLGFPIGTVVELLDEDTVLIEFSGDDGKTHPLVPAPKVLLEPAKSAATLKDNCGKQLDDADCKTAHPDDLADHVISHITPAGGNIFLDLGFPPGEAAQLKHESDKRISAQKGIQLEKKTTKENLRGQKKT